MSSLSNSRVESQRFSVIGAQNVSRMCLVCGVENAFGLKGRFFVADCRRLVGVFWPREEHQSYPGRLHGGVISAILDETIGRAINLAGGETWGVTVEFEVKFRRAVPLDRPVTAVAWITRDRGRVFEGAGEIVLEDGEIAATGSGRYLKMRLEQITSPEFLGKEWFSDPDPVPAEIMVGKRAESK